MFVHSKIFFQSKLNVWCLFSCSFFGGRGCCFCFLIWLFSLYCKDLKVVLISHQSCVEGKKKESSVCLKSSKSGLNNNTSRQKKLPHYHRNLGTLNIVYKYNSFCDLSLERYFPLVFSLADFFSSERAAFLLAVSV